MCACHVLSLGVPTYRFLFKDHSIVLTITPYISQERDLSMLSVEKHSLTLYPRWICLPFRLPFHHFCTSRCVMLVSQRYLLNKFMYKAFPYALDTEQYCAALVLTASLQSTGQ